MSQNVLLLLLLIPAAMVILAAGLKIIRHPFILIGLAIYAISLDHYGRYLGSFVTVNNTVKVVLIAILLIWMMISNKRIRLPWHLVWFLPYFVFAAVSLLYSPNIDLGFVFISRFVLIWLFAIIIANMIETPRHLIFIFLMMFLSSAIVSMLAHMQTLNAFTLAGVAAFQKIGPDAGGVRAISTFWDSNVMGSYVMVLSIFLIALLSIKSLNRFYRIVVLGVLFISFGAILLSFSRSAWLGLAMSLILFFRFKAMRPQIYLFLAIGLVGIVYLNLMTPYGLELASRFSSIGKLQSDYSGNFRLNLILSGFEIWSNGMNWLWGAGFRAFEVMIMENWYYRTSNDMIFHSATHVSHTLWITLLAEGGILGLGLFVLFLRSVFRELRELLRRNSSGVIRIMIICCWVYMVMKMVNFMFNPNPHDNLFWLVLGLIGALERMTRADPSTDQNDLSAGTA
ncbi:MAG: hypothetical protein GY835_26200 [bacterium]|nr:hypothetical protein [bacterium]